MLWLVRVKDYKDAKTKDRMKELLIIRSAADKNH
jgi:hypothetical protein